MAETIRSACRQTPSNFDSPKLGADSKGRYRAPLQERLVTVRMGVAFKSRDVMGYAMELMAVTKEKAQEASLQGRVNVFSITLP